MPLDVPRGGVLLPSDVSKLLVHVPLAQRGSSSRLALSSVVAVVRAHVLRAVEHPRDFVENPPVLVVVWAVLLLCDHTPASVFYPHRVGLLPELVHLLLLAQLLERDVDERRVTVLRDSDDVRSAVGGVHRTWWPHHYRVLRWRRKNGGPAHVDPASVGWSSTNC